MWFVVIGVLMVLLKLLDLPPVINWSWLVVLAPFPLALVWWLWADASGLTRRREMAKDDERKAERRRKNIEALRLGPNQSGRDGR
jgi:small Trp-rich protein